MRSADSQTRGPLPHRSGAAALDAAAAVLSAYRSPALSLWLPELPPPQAELRDYIEDLAQRRAALAHRGKALVKNWRRRFPKGSLPFSPAMLAGESNTLLRWRCSGIDCCPRGGRIELADIANLLATLSAQVRGSILEFESERIALNYEYALVAYAQARLLDLERHRLALAQLRRLGIQRKSEMVRRV